MLPPLSKLSSYSNFRPKPLLPGASLPDDFGDAEAANQDQGPAMPPPPVPLNDDQQLMAMNTPPPVPNLKSPMLGAKAFTPPKTPQPPPTPPVVPAAPDVTTGPPPPPVQTAFNLPPKLRPPVAGITASQDEGVKQAPPDFDYNPQTFPKNGGAISEKPLTPMEKYQQSEAPQRPKSNWLQKLAAAAAGGAAGYVNAAGRTHISPQAIDAAESGILAPGFAGKVEDYNRQQEDLASKANMQIQQERYAGLGEDRIARKEQREAMADARQQDADTRTKAAADKAKAAEDAAKHIKSVEYRKHIEDTITSPFKGDVQYQSKDVPLPKDGLISYVFTENKEEPGMGWMHPDVMQRIPEDLVPYVAGSKVGQVVPWTRMKAGMDAAAKAQIQSEKPTAEKLGSPEQQYMDEYLKSHPGSTKAQAIHQYGIDSQRPQQPPQVMVFNPNAAGGYDTSVVKPGQAVAPGAITSQGVNALNTPTTATRNMAEKAPRVTYFVDRVNQLLDENEKALGPLKSRWREFTAGKVGLKDKNYTQLRTDMGLLTTALMNMHTGARGSSEIMKHFHDLIDSSKQDPDNLRAALQEIKSYASQVAAEGKPAAAHTPPPSTTPPSTSKTVKWGRDANGTPIPLQ